MPSGIITGKTNIPTKESRYKGLESNTAYTTVDNKENTIKVDVKVNEVTKNCATKEELTHLDDIKADKIGGLPYLHSPYGIESIEEYFGNYFLKPILLYFRGDEWIGIIERNATNVYSFSFISFKSKIKYKASGVHLNEVNDIFSDSYRNDFVLEKSSPLPYYEVNISDNVHNFITSNNLQGKPIIIRYTGYFYLGAFISVGSPNYYFEFERIGTKDRYHSGYINLTGLKFSAIFSSTYREDYELEKNKVTSLSSSSTDAQYPSAKLVYDQLALKADKEGPLPEYHVDFTSNVSTFITNNNLQNKPVILHNNMGSLRYLAQFITRGFAFGFRMMNLFSNEVYYSYNLDQLSSTVTFNDLISNTYKQTLEIENNKVTSLSGSSTDVQYPSAKAVYNFSNMIEITWSELKSKRDNSELIPGRFYRITDYTCTTTQANTQSAGHVFDIIVLALSTNKLSEEARAIQHQGDTYFSNSKLEAWQVWYCLDNDTDRFAWADSTNGKGVIYRMIDEFNNDCPYDFKNILFSKTDSYTNAYTFSYTDDGIKDASLLVSKACHNNIMKEYRLDDKHQLNFNVFYSTKLSFNCHNNTFGNDCYQNTFGNYCHSNTFGNSCQNNTFGNSCSSNTFGSDCYFNTFGNDCYFNTFGNGCQNSTFGNSCSSNTFGNNCYSNTFGNDCSYNTLRNRCYYNTFGDSFSTIKYCRYIIIDTGGSYLYINSTDTSASLSNQLQNIHIHLGVQGTSSSNRKIITVDRNLDYTTDVYPIGSTEMFI